MAIILHIETATTTCSVCVAEDGKLLAKKESTEKNIHAAKLTVFVEEVMAQAGKSFSDLQAVAVSMGPGSYTGLRIGVSTAKGLCYALDIPLIAVNTLEAMASGFIDKCFSVNPHTLFCPMIDARRMEVYAAVLNSEKQLIRQTAAVIVDENSFSDLLQNHIIYFFGDGAGKCEGVLGQSLNARVLDDFVNSSVDLIRIAEEKFSKRLFEDVAYFEPYYLKDYVANSNNK